MRPSPPEPPATDATVDAGHVTVEAPTAAQAIARVHERLGPDARIVEADRVLRGGMWGFFPKQVVQLTARAVDAAEAPDPAPAADVRRTPSVEERIAAARAATRRAEPRTDSEPEPPSEPAGLEAVLARLSAREDDLEEGLGTALRRHLGARIDEDPPPPTAASPAPDPAPPVTDPRPPSAVPPGADPAPRAVAAVVAPASGLPLEDVEFARASGTPWSGRGLLMLGLPRGFVDAVLAQEPVDDAAWTYAVSRSLAPLCRPLPTGPAVVAGPRAEKLARALGTPLVRLSGAPRGRSTFAVACTDSGRARTWLATHRGVRWTHLVVGGSDWRGLLFEDPLAVSWVGDDALGDAVRTAHDLGMVLGPGIGSDGAATLVEPAPIELAMRLRDLLGGRR